MSERILLLGGVGLVKGRIKGAGPILREICDELDPFLRESNFVGGAPFSKLSGIIRFGAERRGTPEYQPIDKKKGVLPFSVEVEMAPLRRARPDAVKEEFLAVTLEALEHIADRFGLPTSGLIRFREHQHHSESP